MNSLDIVQTWKKNSAWLQTGPIVFPTGEKCGTRYLIGSQLLRRASEGKFTSHVLVCKFQLQFFIVCIVTHKRAIGNPTAIEGLIDTFWLRERDSARNARRVRLKFTKNIWRVSWPKTKRRVISATKSFKLKGLNQKTVKPVLSGHPREVAR